MIIIGLFNVLYTVSYELFVNTLGADFTIPARVTQVWDYIMNLLANGKAILSLFLDLPYLYFLIAVVLATWQVLILLELISWIFRLIKLQF